MSFHRQARINISQQEAQDLMARINWARSILRSQEFRATELRYDSAKRLFETAYIALGDYLYGGFPFDIYCDWYKERHEYNPIHEQPHLEDLDAYGACYPFRKMRWDSNLYQRETIELGAQIEKFAFELESIIQ